MAIIDSFKDFFGSGSYNYDDEYDDYEDDYIEDDYDEVEKPVKSTSRFEKKPTPKATTSRFSRDYDEDGDEFDDEPVTKTQSRFSKRTPKQSNVVNMNSSRKTYKAKIVTYKPTSIEDSKDIVGSLLDGQAILLNFEGVNNELAQRIIDSMIGACCAVDGTLKKVSSYIWIVAPSSIGLEGEYSDTSSPNAYEYNYRGRYQY